MSCAGGAPKICRLNVNGTIVTGKGATEEEARENVLRKVKEMVHCSPVIPSGEMLRTTMNSAYLGAGRPTNANMVGKLQELCVSKHWPLPIYNLLDSQGPSHMPHFLMTCSVKDLVAVGNGKTKKEAKHSAAQKLLELLRNGGHQDRGSVPVGRVPPLWFSSYMESSVRACQLPGRCVSRRAATVQSRAPPVVRHEVDIVYMERRTYQNPSLQPTETFIDYCENSPSRNGPLLALEGKEETKRSSFTEREPPSISEVTESSKEPIPLPSVEDYLCGRFQDQLQMNDWM